MSSQPITPARRLAVLAGGALIIATWFYLLFVRPTNWESVAGSTEAIITLVGYLGGAALLLAGALPGLLTRTIAIIPVAIVLNVVVGQIVSATGLPLYLDTVGTVLIAALAGPSAGMATGVLSSVVWGLIRPSSLPFAAIAAGIGFLAGWLIRKGAFSAWWKVIISGGFIGLLAGVLSAPVAAFVFGGTAGVGTGVLASMFREMGSSLVEAVTLQTIISDPFDKALVLLIVWLTIRALPKRILSNLSTNLSPTGPSSTNSASANPSSTSSATTNHS